MRDQLTGIYAATTAGTIVGDQRGLLKDNTGYHLPSILCGSEGTLAVVTSARAASRRADGRHVSRTALVLFGRRRGAGRRRVAPCA